MTIKYVGNFTDAMKDFCEEKIQKIANKGIDCENVRVKCTFLPHHEKAVEISINNKIRNSKKGDDFYALVIDVVDSICSQVTRYKKYTHHKKKAIENFDVEMNIEEFENESDTNTNVIRDVARHKIVVPGVMSQDEAIECMEILGHDFFIYKDIDCRNGDDFDICVVYKRLDDTYGKLQCR